MDLRTYLDQLGVNYAWMHHDPTYTAQGLAAREHVSGRRVVKPVVVNADGQFVMCALPSSRRIDIERLKEELHAHEARIATELDIQRLFVDCELGAEPPIGQLWGMPTILDDAVLGNDRVMFQAGTHQDGVEMQLDDYLHLAKPRICRFTTPLA